MSAYITCLEWDTIDLGTPDGERKRHGKMFHWLLGSVIWTMGEAVCLRWRHTSDAKTVCFMHTLNWDLIGAEGLGLGLVRRGRRQEPACMGWTGLNWTGPDWTGK
jgi:hypothetical protein